MQLSVRLLTILLSACIGLLIAFSVILVTPKVGSVPVSETSSTADPTDSTFDAAVSIEKNASQKSEIAAIGDRSERGSGDFMPGQLPPLANRGDKIAQTSGHIGANSQTDSINGIPVTSSRLEEMRPNETSTTPADSNNSFSTMSGILPDSRATVAKDPLDNSNIAESEPDDSGLKLPGLEELASNVNPPSNEDVSVSSENQFSGFGASQNNGQSQELLPAIPELPETPKNNSDKISLDNTALLSTDISVENKTNSEVPEVPVLPQGTDLPPVPELPGIPELPATPELPAAPQLPSISEPPATAATTTEAAKPEIDSTSAQEAHSRSLTQDSLLPEASADILNAASVQAPPIADIQKQSARQEPETADKTETGTQTETVAKTDTQSVAQTESRAETQSEKKTDSIATDTVAAKANESDAAQSELKIPDRLVQPTFEASEGVNPSLFSANRMGRIPDAPVPPLFSIQASEYASATGVRTGDLRMRSGRFVPRYVYEQSQKIPTVHITPNNLETKTDQKSAAESTDAKSVPVANQFVDDLYEFDSQGEIDIRKAFKAIDQAVSETILISPNVVGALHAKATGKTSRQMIERILEKTQFGAKFSESLIYVGLRSELAQFPENFSQVSRRKYTADDANVQNLVWLIMPQLSAQGKIVSQVVENGKAVVEVEDFNVSLFETSRILQTCKSSQPFTNVFGASMEYLVPQDAPFHWKKLMSDISVSYSEIANQPEYGAALLDAENTAKFNQFLAQSKEIKPIDMTGIQLFARQRSGAAELPIKPEPVPNIPAQWSRLPSSASFSANALPADGRFASEVNQVSLTFLIPQTSNPEEKSERPATDPAVSANLTNSQLLAVWVTFSVPKEDEDKSGFISRWKKPEEVKKRFLFMFTVQKSWNASRTLASEGCRYWSNYYRRVSTVQSPDITAEQQKYYTQIAELLTQAAALPAQEQESPAHGAQSQVDLAGPATTKAEHSSTSSAKDNPVLPTDLVLPETSYEYANPYAANASQAGPGATRSNRLPGSEKTSWMEPGNSSFSGNARELTPKTAKESSKPKFWEFKRKPKSNSTSKTNAKSDSNPYSNEKRNMQTANAEPRSASAGQQQRTTSAPKTPSPIVQNDSRQTRSPQDRSVSNNAGLPAQTAATQESVYSDMPPVITDVEIPQIDMAAERAKTKKNMEKQKKAESKGWLWK